MVAGARLRISTACETVSRRLGSGVAVARSGAWVAMMSSMTSGACSLYAPDVRAGTGEDSSFAASSSSVLSLVHLASRSLVYAARLPISGTCGLRLNALGTSSDVQRGRTHLTQSTPATLELPRGTSL